MLNKKDDVILITNSKIIPPEAKKILNDNRAYAVVAFAGEYYGHNANLDFFPEKELIGDEKTTGYITYLGRPFIKYHKKGNRELVIGEVIWVNYNYNIHAVETIVEIDDAATLDLLHEEGFLPVSMSCAPKYDQCSICGNVAYTRAMYCSHIKKALKNLENRLESPAYLINYGIKYIELSLVPVPADPLAYMVKGVDSKNADVVELISNTAELQNDPLLVFYKKLVRMSNKELIELIQKYNPKDFLVRMAKIIPEMFLPHDVLVKKAFELLRKYEDINE